MAEETTALSRAVGNSYNQYFTYNNSTAFYCLAPAYLYQFYNIQVRLYEQWCNGWVPDFHSEETGILPTQFAGSLCQKVADLIYGEGVLYESDEAKNVKNDSLDFIGEFNMKNDLDYHYKDSILKACRLGNALLKLNSDINGDLWVDTIAGNRFFVALNSKGDIDKVMSYVNVYTDGLPKKTKEGEQEPDSYALTEVRYYEQDKRGNRVLRKGKPQPMVEYKIYRLKGPANVFTADEVSVAYDDLPRAVKRAFRTDYNDLPLNTPEKMGLRNLGVYLVKFTPYVTGIPNLKLGESCLAKVMNYLPMYDAINSEELIDLRVSRPKVFLPETMVKKNDTGDSLNGYTDVVVQKIPYKSDGEQSPIVFAPTPREEHFIRMKEDIIKKVCGNLGIATSSLFSDIADARGNVTAREIDSENSNTVLFQNNKRKLMLKPFNELIKDILAYYGMKEDVSVGFTPAGGSNKSIMVDNTTKLVSAGLESKYQAIKELHPEWTDEQISAEMEEMGDTAKEEVPDKKEEDIKAKEGEESGNNE